MTSRTCLLALSPETIGLIDARLEITQREATRKACAARDPESANIHARIAQTHGLALYELRRAFDERTYGDAS